MLRFQSAVCHAVATFTLLASIAGAQTTASTTLKQQITSKYALTKATASRDDIVTAGDVIVLQKDKLLMCATTSAAPTANTYKGGKIQQNALGWMMSHPMPGQTAAVATRTYVTGEKFWLTGLDMKDDGVLFTVMSDPVGDIRYYGTLKFPFPKGSPPPPDQFLATVGEVFSIQGGSDSSGGKSGGGNQSAASQTPPAPAAAPVPPPMATIAPPPPPPDAPPAAPPTIAMGQTRDQVTAVFGAPTRILDKGLTKVYIYPDMKVTFTRDKVSNIQ